MFLLGLSVFAQGIAAQTDSGRAFCLKRVSECQTVCDKIYKGDAWVGCRANCGNSGSCPETKKPEKERKPPAGSGKQPGGGAPK